MLKAIINRLGISFYKGIRLQTILGLLWNAVLLLKWRVSKRIRGIHVPVVHYYAVCWNEEKMLPWLFDNYDRFVTKYYFYDNGSSDATRKMISMHHNTQIIDYESNGIEDIKLTAVKNSCWKNSRGKADLVIICDVDEFMCSDNIFDMIADMRRHHISLPKSEGFDMYSHQFPRFIKGKHLTDVVKKGVENQKYAKFVFFNPYSIVNINYDHGAHVCKPTGIVRYSKEPMYKLLHYKNLGLDYVLGKKELYLKRLSKDNVDHGYGLEYAENVENTIQQFNRKLASAQQIIY